MLCLLTVSAAAAQNLQKKVKNAKGIEVIYQSSYKGKIRPRTDKDDRIGRPSGTGKRLSQREKETATEGIREDKQPVIKNYIDYAGREAYKWAELPDGKIISAATPFEFGKGFTPAGEGKHLGLNCKIARTSINSNTIEVWYTHDIPFRGTPQANVGVPDGLVLKVVRNGDMIQEASAITPLKKRRHCCRTHGAKRWMPPITNIPSTKAVSSPSLYSTNRPFVSTTPSCPIRWKTE